MSLDLKTKVATTSLAVQGVRMGQSKDLSSVRLSAGWFTAAAEALAKALLSLPRRTKWVIAITCDALACVFSVLVAFYLRLSELPELTFGVWCALLLAPVISLPVFHLFGLHREVFRHAGSQAMMLVTYAVACAALPGFVVFTLITVPGVPRTVAIIQPIILLLIMLLSRLAAREWFGRSAGITNVRGRVAIYGAGTTGRQLALALSATQDMIVSMFVDDDVTLQGRTLNGVTIKRPEEMIAAIRSGIITDVLLAMPSATRKRRNEIIAGLRGLQVKVQTIPDMLDLAKGRISIKDVRDLDIDDLLGRAAVPPEPDLLARTVAQQIVMVTGAGGSIGSELCRQILDQQPAKLLLVEQNEFALYQIHAELSSRSVGEIEIIPLLASVRDRARIDEILAAWQPHTIYHAAAYKHVPLVEHNVLDGVANNVFGTQVMADLAILHGVAHFVLISTDKAVRPTNIMGATKRLAEMVLQMAARANPPTCMSMVRFGNVLNSSGSVVPLFRRQIDEGGPITITHPEITRYFMTIPEAAQLVVQAAGLAQGGEVFVLDMGEPVKIWDLARNMILLSGLRPRDETNPDGDIAIEVVGLRPGEKLYEELLIGNHPMPTAHERIMKANEPLPFTPAAFNKLMNDMAALVQSRDVAGARTLLATLVTDYRLDKKIVDWVHYERVAEMISGDLRPNVVIQA
ncbi:polysaccharide biosynthesis protein [Sphingomonas sp. BT-65]|uniref:polysaccharide biosynthesis protein n=1 Tax=Sphingomonas sp. BT-65 TaxID=2989821 RepID=UPI0022365DA7|nr:nucleoside-diphosphate sugar epimerase/dehydratase [Sphingomonas sp. BT-65]MCW4463465.1 polysaccharide biosynthesis protein [Sphingomonas sp. BT-65]